MFPASSYFAAAPECETNRVRTQGAFMTRNHLAGVALGGSLLMAIWVAFPSSAAGATYDDAATARSLADMLRAGRTVVSNNQARINDPAIGDKGLTGPVFLQQTLAIYHKNTGADPAAIDPNSRQGRLQRAQMDAIVEVVDAHQTMLNAPGVGFKGFIPAYFARVVNESFEKRAKGDAIIKVTAPEYLVRNRKARPDAWEKDVIAGKLLAADWPRGQAYSAVVNSGGRQAFRMMMPEYYAASCLSCHGSPKGETDITGFPKEGGKEGDLGAVISIVLYK
jgi:archaellum component FlaG (FlaF/FlaG flagellin family)